MNKNNLDNIISINPYVRDGKPCFKNTRIPVDYVLEHFTKGWNIDEISEFFPELKKKDINKVLRYLSKNINSTINEKENHTWTSSSR